MLLLLLLGCCLARWQQSRFPRMTLSTQIQFQFNSTQLNTAQLCVTVRVCVSVMVPLQPLCRLVGCCCCSHILTESHSSATLHLHNIIALLLLISPLYLSYTSTPKTTTLALVGFDLHSTSSSTSHRHTLSSGLIAFVSLLLSQFRHCNASTQSYPQFGPRSPASEAKSSAQGY